MTDRQNVVFIDTETLGLDADYQPVWEVALILPDGSEHQWFVKVSPRDIGLAHPYALEIGGFHERYNPGIALSRNELAQRLDAFIPQGAHLAGAVVSFDEERLRRLMWEQGGKPPWHYHLIDVEALAVGWLRGYTDGQEENEVPYPLPWKSEDLSREIGVDPAAFEPKHTALADARWAKAIYEVVMRPRAGGSL